jgi:dipeptidyl aminopeptidase/acylaminoacyl peptidase
VITALLFSALASAPALEAHAFSINDMHAMQRIAEPRVSPDQKWVLFSVRSTDLEANKGRFDLWLAAVDGSSIRQLTKHEANETSGRWSSDGKRVLFLSNQGGSSQVWQIAIDGGEAQQLTKLPLDVEGFVPFSDGKRLALFIDVYPDLAREKVIADTVARNEQREKSKVKARVYEQLLFRHWDSWEDGKRSHIFVWESGAEPVDLMAGFDADSPTKPFGGAEEVAISADGRDLVFTALANTREAAWANDVNLWHVPTDGAAGPRNLTADNPGIDAQPVFSPGGTSLAWLSMERAGYESDRNRVVVMDWASRNKRVLAETWDRSPSELSWAADGQHLLVSAANLGNQSIFAIEVGSGKPRMLIEAGTSASPSSAGERIIFAHDTLRSPVELMSMARDGSDVRAITKLNFERVAATKMGDFEQFTFPGWNDEKVHGYVVKPIDFDASKKYPVAFLIHGGPQGSFGNHFHYRWNPQAYAGAGFAAVMIDFHGSTGYGQAFTDSIRGDWGGKPYEDLMKGLDAALAKYPFLDGTRVAALGASYGGYMINWIAGHTDRFRCLVNHDGNLDERMAYFDTEELWFPEWEHGGTPWEKPEGYAKHNPIDFVKNWKTPMLVIHGALDYRVVDTQGISTFTALQRKGIPSKFLSFPDENHWVLKPQNSVLWHDTVLGWITQWTGPAGSKPVKAASNK